MLDLADDFKAVAFVKGQVARVGGLQICRAAFLIDTLEHMLHEGGPQALAQVTGIAGDEIQIPVRLVGMGLRQACADVNQIFQDLRACRFRHDLPHGVTIGLNPRGQPQGGGPKSVDFKGGPFVETAAGGSSDEARLCF